MMPKRMTSDARTRLPTNVTRPNELVAEAKALQVNVSHACEIGLARAVGEAHRARWLEENAQSIEDHNAMIECDGLILDEFRQF